MLGHTPVVLAAWYLLPSTYMCAVALSISGVLAAAAGIGGGGIIVAVLMFFGDLQPHEAVPVSKAVVFSGVLVSSALNVRKAAPRADGGKGKESLVDYDIVATVVPMALAGTLLGVWANSRVNGMVIVLLLTGTLISMVVTTSLKLHEQIGAEQAEDESSTSRVSALVPRVQLDSGHVGKGAQEPLAPISPRAPLPKSPRGPGAVVAFESKESKASAPGAVAALVVTLVALLAMVILGGVMHAHLLDCHKHLSAQRTGVLEPVSEISLIQTKSMAWGLTGACDSSLLHALFNHKHASFLGGPHGVWLATFPLVMSAVCCFVCFMAVVSGSGVKKSMGGEDKPYKTPVGLTAWLLDNAPPAERMCYASMALVTGILAGLVGIGGGLIFSPFMIMMGVNPHVAVATSTFCVIFTSTSTTLQYLLLGRIYVPLAMCYGLCNQFSSAMGTHLIHHIQDKYPSRRSYPTAIVLVAVVVSAFLTLAKLQSMYRSLA